MGASARSLGTSARTRRSQARFHDRERFTVSPDYRSFAIMKAPPGRAALAATLALRPLWHRVSFWLR